MIFHTLFLFDMCLVLKEDDTNNKNNLRELKTIYLKRIMRYYS